MAIPFTRILKKERQHPNYEEFRWAGRICHKMLLIHKTSYLKNAGEIIEFIESEFPNFTSVVVHRSIENSDYVSRIASVRTNDSDAYYIPYGLGVTPSGIRKAIINRTMDRLSND